MWASVGMHRPGVAEYAQVTSTSGVTLDFFFNSSTNVLNILDGQFHTLGFACSGM
jgi:hypothetical protein